MAIETDAKAKFEAETKLKRKLIDALEGVDSDTKKSVLQDVGRVCGFEVTFK